MDTSGHSSPGVFVPAMVLAVAVAGWFLFQTVQMLGEQTRIKAAIDNQNAQMEQSVKVRTALESLANRTARLARNGNANATLIVEELRKRGITIKSEE
jgi:hypothetical protein